MQDPVAVALERRAQATVVLGAEPSTRLVGADGERRQRSLLLLAHLRLEGVGDLSGKFGHRFQAR